MLITVEMNQEDVMQRLQQVRHTLERYPMPHAINITLSFGMTYLEMCDGMSLEAIIHDVDDKLYQAKKTGRDKIVSQMPTLE